MKSPFAILGVQPGASPAEIKQAYARLLKETRPDEDAAGFQRLQEAFEACLRIGKIRQVRAERVLEHAGDEDEDEDEDTDEVTEPDDPLALPQRGRQRLAPPITTRFPTQPPAPARSRARPGVLTHIERRRLLEELLAGSEELSPARLQQRLDANEALISLDVKREVASVLPDFLARSAPHLDTDKLRVLLEFFIGADYNAGASDPQLRALWQRARKNDWDAKFQDLQPRPTSGNGSQAGLGFGVFFAIFLLFKLAVFLKPASSDFAIDADRPEVRAAVLAAQQRAAANGDARDFAPWAARAAALGINETPKFGSVDEAFRTLIQVVTPAEPYDSPYRGFHVSEGPFSGDWIFSGGDRSRPDFMVHYPLATTAVARTAGQVLCRSENEDCVAFRTASALAPAFLSSPRWQSSGGMLTWDSPGTPPIGFNCPPGETRPTRKPRVDALPVSVLFDGAGHVMDVALRDTSGDAGVDEGVRLAALRCSIEAHDFQPGTLETDIEIIRATPPLHAN